MKKSLCIFVTTMAVFVQALSSNAFAQSDENPTPSGVENLVSQIAAAREELRSYPGETRAAAGLASGVAVGALTGGVVAVVSGTARIGVVMLEFVGGEISFKEYITLLPMSLLWAVQNGLKVGLRTAAVASTVMVPVLVFGNPTSTGTNDSPNFRRLTETEQALVNDQTKAYFEMIRVYGETEAQRISSLIGSDATGKQILYYLKRNSLRMDESALFSIKSFIDSRMKVVRVQKSGIVNSSRSHPTS